MRREGEASRNLWLTRKDANFGHTGSSAFRGWLDAGDWLLLS
jgi:hypothetical protein